MDRRLRSIVAIALPVFGDGNLMSGRILLSLTIEEAYEQGRNLIAMGRERGYLLFDEINDVLPADSLSSEEIETLILTIERSGH